jgi:hypothetical protein
MRKEIPLNHEVAQEVAEAGELGGESEDGGFYASVPDQPIAVSLRRVFRECGEGQFEELTSSSGSPFFHLYRRFELWLVPHGVSIIRRRGIAEITCVGIEVEYRNEDRTCSVRALLPSFQYITRGSIGGSILANGETRLPTDGGLGDLVWEWCGLRFGLKAGGNLELNFQATVATPKVSATGCFSSRCEWRFDADKVPLFGRDIGTWAIVALPKRQEMLSINTRYYFERRVAFFSQRTESGWIPVQCVLEK